VNQASERYGSAVAAAFLACLTIRVFFELQDYGPESAIRKFNEAVKNNDLGAMQAATLGGREGLKGDKVPFLFWSLTQWDRRGIPMQIERIKRTGNEVRAEMVLTIPHQPHDTIWAMTWVVERTGRDWLVDANKTATILSDRRLEGNYPRD